MQHKVLEGTFLCHLFELFENHPKVYLSREVHCSGLPWFWTDFSFILNNSNLESHHSRGKHIWNCTSRFTPTSLFLWALVSPGTTSTTSPPYKNLHHIHPKQLEPSFYFESRRTEDRTGWARRSKWLCLVLATLASPPLPNSLSGGSRCRLL